jgi:tetratricopeptide (TPR) repeat protein
VRLALAAAIAALWILHAAAPQPPAADREAAYRANNQGVALLERFSYDEAARAFREALRLSPALDIARLNLAIADFYAGRPDEAAAAARASAARMPSSPTAHFLVGLIAKAENRVDEAAPAFARVLELDPLDAGTLISLGQIRLQQREYATALSMFERALAAEPYNVTAAYNTAIALTRAGRADEGRAAMQRFERLRDSVYGVTYAQTYLAQGRYGEAIASTGAEPELVDPTTPAVTFEDATASWLGANAAASETAGAGSVSLFDANNDGLLDVLVAGQTGARLLRNQGGGRITDDTSRAGLQGVRSATGALAADVDNDGRPDLFFISTGASSLFRQRADGGYADVSAAASLPAAPAGVAAVAAADIDHDGDLDLLLAGTTAQVLRNNGNTTFTDVSAAAGFAGALGTPVAIAPTDYDNRRDIDVLIAGPGRAPSLYRNMRDGTFQDVAASAGLDAPADYGAVGVGDANKDGYPDLFLGRRGADGVLALGDGRGRFRIEAAPPGTTGAIAAQFVDYDNDGLLDLMTLSAAGSVHLARNIGGGRWNDVTRAAALPDVARGAGAPQAMALGDLDNDGDTDAAIRTATGALRLLRNAGGSRNASLRVRLTSRVSNRSAVGAKVELRAGSLRQMLETSSSSPSVSPSDVVFGLGARRAADVVRVLWPSGILQAETTTSPAPGTRDLAIAELDRKPSSCPYLFTWNGTRFEFITDFMGGGEMGAWAGPGLWNQPDPDEYVRIRGDQLRARDGLYELRVTNELEEAVFVDRLQLVAVDHPRATEVYPNEGLRQGPRAPLAIHAVRDGRPPLRAVDDHGHDVLPQVTSLDRRYVDDFARLPIRGYAAVHSLSLDLGPGSDRPVLLLTGWTDYAFSSDNVAAAQSGATMTAPSLQVKDAAGTWRTVIEDIGFPVGRPQTIVVDLAGRFLSASREVRIVTSMRIYWDQVQVASPAGHTPRLTRLAPMTADLHWRGFSAELAPDGREPFGYDYDRVGLHAPWKVPVGRYTREGDVRPLVGAVDDMFAISRPGDELAVAFDARALKPLPAGWTRTFLLYAHGYSKEMNPRSATPDTVAPLPFRSMTRYPYGADERFPWTLARRRYDERYNTRFVTRSIPAIDGARVAK